MDIQRPSNAGAKKIRRIAYGTGAVILIAGVTLGLSRLRPAAPTVEAATIWPDTVKRGPMLREVRGLGTLIPEDIRWIPAQTDSRVDRIVLRPDYFGAEQSRIAARRSRRGVPTQGGGSGLRKSESTAQQ